MQDDLMKWVEAAKEASRRGAAVLQQWRSRFTVKEKGRADLVTDADHASQQAVFSYLAEQFPSHQFFGEEQATKVQPDVNSPPTWIVDPLDGTTNYVHDLPLYCVSIGLQVAGELVVGVVNDPSRNELFWAARGKGAWLNDQRIHVSKTEDLSSALLSTGFSPEPKGKINNLDWWIYFNPLTHSIRRTGSTAINLAWVAAGRFDSHWGFDNHAWDVAGGTVLVREAGGTVANILTHKDGTPDSKGYDPFQFDILATNSTLHPHFVEAFRKGIQDTAKEIVTR